jgi:hypothetical protein
MPLLFWFPMIVASGMWGLARDAGSELRAFDPTRRKATARPSLHERDRAPFRSAEK